MRFISVTLMCIILFSCEEKTVEATKRIRPVKYAKVTSSSQVEKHTFSGVVKAQNETNLSFKVGGKLVEVNFKSGDRIRKGQLLARIDPTDYSLQTNQAISQKDGSVANARAADVQLIAAQASYDRLSKLYENNSISLNEYQQSKASLDAAKAQYEAATSQVELTNQQIQAANNQVIYTRLVSPMDGVITAINVEANEVVNAGSIVATLSSVGRPEIEVGIPEVFIARIAQGQQVSTALPSTLGESFVGKVKQVAYSAGNSPTYPVIVELDKATENIRPGMAAKSTFFFDKMNQDTIIIAPIAAVGEDSNGNYVFVLKKKQEGTYSVEKTDVKIRNLVAEGFEVMSGLSQNDLVVTAGLQSLMSGLEVKLLN